MGSALYGEAIPTYEGLRTELIDNYGNIVHQDNNGIHRSNPMYSARIETVEVHENDMYQGIAGRNVSSSHESE
jgi:hypothetical protein